MIRKRLFIKPKFIITEAKLIRIRWRKLAEF